MPERESELLRAVELLIRGDWPAAHEIAQEREGDPIANWIHAVVHRMEGDLGNARYWYRRCERRLREDLLTEEEILEIRAALLGGEGSPPEGSAPPDGKGSPR